MRKIHKQELLLDKQPHHVGAQSEELHDACWREDVETIRTLVGEDPSMLNESDSGGQNVLHLAAFWGSLRVCETLLALGIDVDAVNLHRQRPLDIALQWGHLDVADAIRHRGGTSLFETKVMHLEAHNLQLEDELTRARADLLAEREKRETMQHERERFPGCSDSPSPPILKRFASRLSTACACVCDPCRIGAGRVYRTVLPLMVVC